MGIVALVFGIIGWLCAVMGIITAAEVIPLLGAGFTVMFWLVLSVISLLACIAAALFRTSYE